MFDVLIKKLKEEIAVNGTQGMAIPELWNVAQDILRQIVVDHQTKPLAIVKQPVVDEGYKSSLWPFLRRDPDLLYYNGHPIRQEPEQSTAVANESSDPPSSPKNAVKNATTKGKGKTKAKPKKTTKKKKRRVADSDDDYEADETLSESSEEEIEYDDENDSVKNHAQAQTQTVSTNVDLSQRTLITDIRQLDYREMEQKYQSSVWIVASEKLQMLQMKIGIPPGSSISSNCLIVMKTILQTRAKGITQADITNTLGLDPRSTGHYVKTLEEKGVIVRKALSLRGIRTNLCVHVRFSRENSMADGQLNEPKAKRDWEDGHTPHNVNTKGVAFSTKDVQEKMAELLLDANDYVMFSEDIMGALAFNVKDPFVRKWFNRTVDTAAQIGLIRKFSSQVNGTGPLMRCLQLIDPDAVRKQLSKKESLKSKATAIAICQSETHEPPVILNVKVDDRQKTLKLWRDESIEYQIVMAVTNADVKGLTQKDIQYTIGCQDTRMIYRLLEKLVALNDDSVTKYTLRRVLEFEGRTRRYRYYTLDAYSRVHEDTTVQIAGAPPLNIDTSVLVDEDWSAIKYAAKSKTQSRPRKVPRTKADSSVKSNPSSALPQQHQDANDASTSNPVMDNTPTNTSEPPHILTSDASRVTEESAEVTDTNQLPAKRLRDPAHDDDEPLPVKKKRDEPPSSTEQAQRPTENTNLVSSSDQSNLEPSQVSPPTTETRKRPKRGNLLDYFRAANAEASHTQISSSPETTSTETNILSAIEVESTDTSTTTSNDTGTVPTDDSVTPLETDTPLSETDDSSPGRKKAKQAVKLTKDTRRNVQPIFITPGGLRVNHHRNKHLQRNVYYEQRKKILLAILDEKPIHERGVELMNCFVAKKAELFPNQPASTHSLCLKTLWKTAEMLAKEGVAQLREGEVTFFNGEKSVVKLLLHHNLDKNGPEVEKYLALLNQRKAVHPRSYKTKRFEKLNDVERLEDRLLRLEEEQTTHVERNDMTNAKRIGDQIRNLRNNISQINTRSNPKQERKEKSWMAIGVQYGYVGAKMMRVKLLHQYLFGLLKRGDIDGIDVDKCIIPSRALIDEITLGQFLQIVGLLFRSDVVHDYIQNPEHLQKLVIDTPDEVRAVLFSERNKFRRRLRPLFDTLWRLHLLEPTLPDGIEMMENVFLMDQPSNLAFAYKLNMRCPMYDYRCVGTPLIREYTFESQTDLSIYWSDLQYMCTKMEYDPSHLRQPENPEEESLFKAIYALNNWSTMPILTRHQRKVLNSMVDRTSGKTPVNDLVLCNKLSDELMLPVAMIRRFFRKAEVQFASKAEERNARRRQRTLQRLEKTALSERLVRQRRTTHAEMDVPYNKFITLDTRRVFRKTHRAPTTQEYFKRRQFPEGDSTQRSSALFLDDEREFPHIDQDEVDVSQFQRKRASVRYWKSEEDELLFMCYAILKHRAAVCRKRFFWRIVECVFPNRESQSCRHRLERLREKKASAAVINNLCTVWRTFHAKGIQSGAISDGDTADVEAFDILAHLEYFISQMKLCNSDMLNIIEDPALPNTLDELFQRFDIDRRKDEQTSDYFEDDFHKRGTLIARHTLLCRNIYALRGTREHTTDDRPLDMVPESDADARKLQILQVFFKMILMTPREVYDPLFAYRLLNQYPEPAVKKAIEMSRRSGILIKAKGARALDRRLPGMIYGIAERFLDGMAGQLPSTYNTQAQAYEQFLSERIHDLFSPVQTSSGMMGCILDLLADTEGQPKLSLEIIDMESFMQKSKKPYSRSRMIDSERHDFEISLRFNRPRKQQNNAPKLRVCTAQLKSEEVDVMLSGLVNIQKDPLDADCMKAVVDCLTKKNENGANICDIKEHVVRFSPSVTDERIHKAIKTLQHVIPPLIYEVGFEAPRFVLATHINSWNIIPEQTDTPLARQIDAMRQDETLLSLRSDVISPRTWVDVNGNTTDAVFKGCLEIIAETVMMRPGITEAMLAEKFKTFLTRMEVRECLRELVRKHVLRSIVVAHQSTPKVNLFSKRRVFSAIDASRIESSAQTAYFPMPGYYCQLA